MNSAQNLENRRSTEAADLARIHGWRENDGSFTPIQHWGNYALQYFSGGLGYSNCGINILGIPIRSQLSPSSLRTVYNHGDEDFYLMWNSDLPLYLGQLNRAFIRNIARNKTLVINWRKHYWNQDIQTTFIIPLERPFLAINS